MGKRKNDVILFERHKNLYGKQLKGRYCTIERPYPTHSHEYFEIELIVEGSGYQILNGERYPLCPGTFYLLTPEDIHSVHPDGAFTNYNISFEEEFFSDSFAFERLMSCHGKLVLLTGEDLERTMTLIKLLHDEAECRKLPQTHAYMQSLLNCILIEFLRLSETNNVQSTDGSMRQVLFYILRHFREPITMELVAGQAHLSTSYFCKAFKRTTGQCFTDYLTDMRVRFAARLLQSTNIAVTDVCYQSGFNSFSSFSRTFKKQYGITPSAFRQQNRE